jgi:catechol 2,3-dioxygenase-like lactoylglutathione lyase family enzyme
VPLDGKLGKAGGAGPGAEARNVDHFALEIVPFDEAAIRAHLTGHGITIGEYGKRYGAKGDGPSIYVTDPDGNVVELKGPPG